MPLRLGSKVKLHPEVALYFDVDINAVYKIISRAKVSKIVRPDIKEDAYALEDKNGSRLIDETGGLWYVKSKGVMPVR